ncbi:anthranilate synthase component I family protein [Aneurinibacillus soli]
MNVTETNPWSRQQLNEYDRVPLWDKKTWGREDPWQLYRKLREQSEYAFIIESGRSGRYTYVGANPVATLTYKDGQACYNGQTITTLADPLAVVRRWMCHEQSPSAAEAAHAGLPDWYGGAVGYLSYDMGRYYEKLPRSAQDDLKLPDVYLMMAEEVYAFDHVTREIYVIVHVGPAAQIKTVEAGTKWLKMMVELLYTLDIKPYMSKAEGEVSTLPVVTSFDQTEFEEAVRRVQQYIGAGDVFQVNLSVRQTRTTDADAEAIYEVLRQVNPSPYMGLLRFPEFQLVSASPELLVQVKGGKLSTRPIAGTRRRGKDDVEDEALVQEMLGSEKEVAEHIMLVDLERNDLGRVSRYGSVHVDELMVVEKYSHVMHIVSNVVGELAEDKDMYDAIVATFPGGTITGAPKVRTMEIIEELEKVTRGPYTGSMCLLGFDGDAVCNIIIRTMILKDGQAHVQAGAGIVIDSTPKAEYYESLKKAEAVWKALALTEDQLRRV